MPDPRACPVCKTKLPTNAPQGLCPRCLAGMGVSLLAGASEPVARPVRAESAAKRFGDYELLDEIARGGMGIVYRARQVSLNRIVAVKVLLFGRFSSEEFVERFRSEAEAAAALQHPNIVAIHEIGEHDGQRYFSMAYIEGKNLAEVARDKPLPAKLAATYLQTVAEAIHYAHQRGVLHRDLKPSNVVVDSDGQPHVTDFGLAKRLGDESELTVTGQVLGSPNYMSPEQADRKRGEVTSASDVYSLGAVLYHLLTGRPPFVGETLEDTLLQLLNAEAVAPRLLNASVPRDLETICLKCLSKEPARRYTSAGALATDLGRWQSGEPIEARPASASGRLWRWCVRKPAIATLAFSVLLLLITVATVSTTAVFRIERARQIALKAGAEAREAQRETQQKLLDSYLAQARANRFSGRIGRRFDSLEILAKAAAIRPGPELRNEAIACMALSDLRLAKRLPRPSESQDVIFNESMTQYAILRGSGEISILQVSDNAELRRLPSVGAGGQFLHGFSHDGRFLAVGYARNVLHVWEIETQEHAMAGSACLWRGAVDFDKAGDRIAMVDAQSRLVVHEFSTGHSRVIPIEVAARFVSFDDTGTRLAVSGSVDSTLFVLDVTTGLSLHTLTHERPVRGLAWHPNGKMLATINHESSGRLVHLWDTQTGRKLRTLSGHLEDLDHVTFGPSGEFLFSTGWDGTRVWNSETGESVLALPGAAGVSRISTDGKLLARQKHETAEWEVYQFALGAEGRKLLSKEPVQGPKAVAFSPGGEIVAYAVGGTLTFFDVVTGQSLMSEPVGIVHSLHFDATTNLWTSGEHGLSRRSVILDSNSGQVRLGQPEAARLKTATAGAALSADRRTLAVVHNDHAHVFDTFASHELARTPGLGDLRCVSLNANGQLLATASWQAEAVSVLKARTGSLVANVHQASSYAVFSPNDIGLLVGGERELILWEANGWQPQWRLAHSDFTVATFAPGGTLVAVREAKSQVHLLDPGSGKLLAILEAPGGDHVQDLAFSPNNRHLAQVQSSVRELILWDLKLIRMQLAEMKLDWESPMDESAPK